ncbi:MAG TPA: hypothetical protein VIW45_07710, partial [Vicinamibacterales bacterium]
LLANGSDQPTVAADDKWQGLYRFDTVTAKGVDLVSWDPIESTDYVVEGAVTHDSVTTTNLRVNANAALRPHFGVALNITATNEVRVDAGGAIDAAARGYQNFGTYPGYGPATNDHGGTHVGRGGRVTAEGRAYGSVTHPHELGAAGSAPGSQGYGGGAIAIKAASVIVNGTITAAGLPTTGSAVGGGAGGSVYITTNTIGGSGTISAEGAPACLTGGGGAVAVEYSAASTLPAIRTSTGYFVSGGCSNVYGAPGSIFTKGPQETYGTLTVDSDGRPSGMTTELPPLGNGSAQGGSGGSTLVTDRAANVPDFFAGHWIEITNNSGTKGLWRIGTINAKTITLLANGNETINVQQGDRWRGVYRFDTIKLRGAKLVSVDAIRYGTLDKDASSSLVSNDGAPLFASGKPIAIESVASNDYVSAPAGTVSDGDTPIVLTATNVRSAAQFTANANADGSFRVPVSGTGGDTFTIKATDSHVYPLSSAIVPVTGAIPERNGVASLALSPSTVGAGDTATGTVQLQTAAVVAATVALSSNKPDAIVPATVSVPAGAASAQFTITTLSNSSGATVTITASFGVAAATATLNVLPAGAYLTTATGRIVDERARPLANAAVTCAGRSGTSQSTGVFIITDVQSSGTVTCSATLSLADATTLSGTSATVVAVANGMTNVGDVVLRPTITFGQFNTSAWGVDSGFRARTVSRDGKTLVVSSIGSVVGDSDRIALFDLTNPAAPSLIRSVPAGNTAIYDVEVANGYAFIASYDFCSIDIASTASSKQCYGSSGAVAVALANQYALVATNNNFKILIYDVSTPSAVRFVREQDLFPGSGGGKYFWDLLNLGNGYLAGLSYTSTGSTGHDVVIIDARDINNLVKVADFDIPNFVAARGRVSGSMLYLSGANEVAVVDLSNPASPSVVSRAAITGGSDNLNIAGSDVFATAGANGLAQIDVSVPSAPFVVKTIPTGGTANDLLFYSNYVYVANETGLAVARLPIAPQIDRSRITLARQTPNVSVTGTAMAITGAAPITVTVTNRTTGATATGFAVAGDGSFTASIAASPADAIAVTAFDVAGRSSALTDVGTAPFGTSVLFSSWSMSSSYRARIVRTDGTYLGVTSWWADAGHTSQVAVFDISANPAAPQFKYVINNGAAGDVYDLEVAGGYAYLAAGDFCTLNLASASSSPSCVSMGGGELGVAVSGNIAFSSSNATYNDGRIRIYDVSNPAAPALIREQGTTTTAMEYYDLLTYGNYLIGVGPYTRDVVILDRSNLNNLVKVADLDLPDFDAARGAISGTLLYLVSLEGKIAIVDLATPSAPVLRNVLSGAIAHGVTASGTRAIFAGSMLGALYLDAASPSSPTILGYQATSGNAWGVVLRNGVLYVANEQGLAVVPNANP